MLRIIHHVTRRPAGSSLPCSPEGGELAMVWLSAKPLVVAVVLAAGVSGVALGQSAAQGATAQPSGPRAGVLTQVSSDPYTNSSAQHATETEPDTYSAGTTVVSAFQVARFSDGGADNVGWATSTDNGTTWKHGFLPGLTTSDGGTYARASDAAVAFDAKHHTWLISTLDITASIDTPATTVSLSTDGLTWSTPVLSTGNNGESYDKNWITCDDTATSPHYGNCYVEADVTGNNNQIVMATSHDGGHTWSKEVSPAGTPSGLGGQPLVQPNGTVVVPYSENEGDIRSFTSTNGGTSWTASVLVATVTSAADTGMRSGPLPSATIDASGKVYVVWEDCRFRTGCTANDIVLATSTNGKTWSAVARIPIDATTSSADHFIPGIGADPATSGATAKLGLYYYFYPNAGCSTSTCTLEEGYVSSTSGGATWSAPRTLTGPMSLSWLAQAGGVMVGDYQACAVHSGTATGVFAVGAAPSGSKLKQAMDTAGPLPITGGALAASTAGSQPLTNSQPTTHPTAR